MAEITLFKPAAERESGTGSDAVIRESFPVGKRFRCTLTASPDLFVIGGTVAVKAQWAPRMPKRLTKGEWRDYRAGRDRFYGRVAAATGLRMALVEL